MQTGATSKANAYFLFFTGLTFPVLVWCFFAYGSSLLSLDEIFAVILNPFLLVFLIILYATCFFSLEKRFRKIDAFIIQATPQAATEASYAINQIPLLYVAGVFALGTLGPLCGMVGKSFVTFERGWLMLLLALALVASLGLSFLLLLILSLDRSTENIPLAKETLFWSIRKRLIGIGTLGFAGMVFAFLVFVWLFFIRGEVEQSSDPVKIFNIFIFFTVALLSFELFPITLLLNRISKKVRLAIEVAEKVAKSETHGGLPADERDETGLLCLALNDMSRKLEQKFRLTKQIANKDLTAVFTETFEDKLMDALKQINANFRTSLLQTLEVSRQVGTAAQQLSDASQSLSQGATEQAAALQEISSGNTQLVAQTTSNAKRAREANQFAKQTHQSAEKGNHHMSTMLTAIHGIHDASRSISEIIKIIDSIAFQTNLLSLNAAVEAARAGKHGKGFAVVAEEVRTLAAKSAKSAKETEALITDVVNQIDSGVAMAEQTDSILQEILQNSLQVTSLVKQIADDSDQQAESIAQIGTSLTQINTVTQNTSANAEESASATQELARHADTMLQTLNSFRLER